MLDPEDLLMSMDRLAIIHDRDGFNDEAKYGPLRFAVMKNPAVATFAVYMGASTYLDLKKTVKDLESG